MRGCALDHRPHQTPDAAGFRLGLDLEMRVTAPVFEPVPHGEANGPRDAVQCEQPLRLELGHLDLGACVEAEEAALVLEVGADSHLPVRDLMRRERARLPLGHVLRLDQVLPNLVHGLGDLDVELEADHCGAAR